VKKTLFIIFLIVLITVSFLATACSKSGLHGSFEGILPCVDCPGLQAEITINTDGTFFT